MSTPDRPSSQVTTPIADNKTEDATEDNGSQQLAVAVDDLIDQLQNKFDGVSKEIYGKLDDMARRLDQLEASVAAANDPSQST